MKTLQNIKNPSEFEDVCDDILNEFMDSLTLDSPYIREVDEQDMEEWDMDECTLSFIFTTKGMRLMERYISRLQKLGERLYPEDNIEVQCSGIITP